MEELKTDTRIAGYTRGINGLIEALLKPLVKVTQQDVLENQVALDRLMTMGKSPFLIEFPGDVEFEPGEIIEIFAGNEHLRLKSAEALVVHNDYHYEKLLSYQNYYLLNHPVEIFPNRKEALEWLSDYL